MNLRQAWVIGQVQVNPGQLSKTSFQNETLKMSGDVAL